MHDAGGSFRASWRHSLPIVRVCWSDAGTIRDHAPTLSSVSLRVFIVREAEGS
jgi:hypothetical protein